MIDTLDRYRVFEVCAFDIRLHPHRPNWSLGMLRTLFTKVDTDDGLVIPQVKVLDSCFIVGARREEVS